ncbi:MAG: glycosyltransferase family 2 protein, partial [Candidatus Binatia bacterium]
VCQDEGALISRCLETVAWCDEIVVVDGGSHDDTVARARAFSARVITNPWPGYRAQKQFALDQARHEWVLNVDADERVSPELRSEIQRELNHGDSLVNGYWIPRLVYYLGRWWYRGGWFPDYRLRLFRRERAIWGGVNPHEKVIVEGTTKRLAGRLLHFTYRDVTQHLTTVNRLTDISAQELLRRRGRVARHDIVFRPLWRLFRSLVVDRAILEGWAGLFVAVTGAFYVYLKYAKATELERAGDD